MKREPYLYYKTELKLMMDTAQCDYDIKIIKCVSKLMKVFAKQGHSGMSASITKHMFDRLVDCKPLTPITAEDFENGIGAREYETFPNERGLRYSIQCKRYPTLFKNISINGDIKYSDNNRVVCYDISDDEQVPFYCGLEKGIIEDRFPIILPYFPTEPYKVYEIERLIGKYASKVILYAITPTGGRVEINRYFVECDDGSFKEVTEDEYRKMIGKERKEDNDKTN